jgi:D-erythronate 2-dehydrogenase
MTYSPCHTITFFNLVDETGGTTTMPNDEETVESPKPTQWLVLITGAGGFLGQRLFQALWARPTRPSCVLLTDLQIPPSLRQKLERNRSVRPEIIVETLPGDLSDPLYMDRIFERLKGYTEDNSNSYQLSVFHLGAVMSGDGERDFDLCMKVNFHGGLQLLEGIRKLHSDDQMICKFAGLPKFLFCSAGATIGAGCSTDYVQSQDVISDSCRATPHSTYGMTKACLELLMNDYSRRGMLDGRGIRLPTVIVRAGKPNAATTGCFSSIIREPLAGVAMKTLPIAPDVRHAVTGARAAVEAMLQLHDLDATRVKEVLGYDCTIFIPAISVSLQELERMLYQVVAPACHDMLGKIGYQVDASLSKMVGSFPAQIDAYRARQLGIGDAPTVETVIREYIEDFPEAIADGITVVPPAVMTNHLPIPSDRNVAIITGAGSGIGRAVAERLIRDDQWVVILAGRRLAPLQETQRNCMEYLKSMADPKVDPTRCMSIRTDVTVERDVVRLFQTVHSTYGRVDLLFNNAGVNSTATSIEKVTLADMQHVLSTNVIGPFLCAREAIKIMSQQKPRRGGRIINNGSLSAHVPRPGSTTYATSKHALTGLTKCIALDGRAHNIACGQVDFGNIVTALSLATNKEGVGALQANGTTTLEPSMNVEDAAETVYTMTKLPLEANILQMTVMATAMPFVGRG